MKEHNFHISVKYGLTPQIFDFEWKSTITSTEFDDEHCLIESFRAFYNHIKSSEEFKKTEDYNGEIKTS